MARFHSKLDTIEKIRKEAENAALLEMAKKQRDLAQAVSEKSRLLSELSRSLTDRETSAQISGPATHLGMIDNHVKGTKQRLLQIDHKIQIFQKNLTKVREKYFAKKRDREAITRLKEIEFERFKSRQRKIEQKKLDEIYTMRASRMIKTLAVILFLSVSTHTSFAEEKCIVNKNAISDLRKQKDEISTEKEEIAKQRQELEAKEKAIAEQSKQLEQLKKEILGIEAANFEKNEAKVNKLVETVETMSPKKAAELIAGVDEQLAVATMMKLTSAKLAKVLNVMDSERSQYLSELMAIGRAKAKKKDQSNKPKEKKEAQNDRKRSQFSLT